MTIEIREVRIADHAQEALALFRENWEETGFNFELDADIATYQRLQDRGAVVAVAAFNDGRLIGYSTAFISPHLFNPSVVCCMSDALYVRRDYRNGSTGARLIKATEQLAAERGASLMMWHTRAGTPLGKTLEKRGYTPADVIVMKGI